MAREAVLLEGKVLAQKIQEGIQKKLKELSGQGVPLPKLRAFQVSPEASAEWYLSQQEKMAGKLGIPYEKIPPEKLSDERALTDGLEDAGRDPAVAGVFVTLPLPANCDADRVLLAMPLKKDVEGVHPANLGLIVLRRGRLLPPTAAAAFRLIESTGIEFRGKKAVVVGQSAVVGRPLQMLLGEKRVTTVVCNSGTSTADLVKFISEADLVIGCAGQPGLIRGSWIKPGAVVIDVGTTEVDGKLVGDVEFESARMKASFITPVPGGVGPLTVTLLMENLIKAYEWQRAGDQKSDPGNQVTRYQ